MEVATSESERGSLEAAGSSAIVVRELRKAFPVRGKESGSLRDQVLHHGRSSSPGQVEALRGIDLRIEAGEAVGIVGRNGSGKTTLLRCIAGIYRPDSGSVEVNGQVSPFIQLGPAFDAELTSTENAVLTAVALGVPIRVAKRHAAGIVEGAGLEGFAGHQLKNLSSGMAARLAFTATNTVMADILLFDEVFSVGDRAFRKRCEARFETLKDSGHTVVLVSHDLGVIREHCDRAILLDRGELIAEGDPDEVADAYAEASDRAPTAIGAVAQAAGEVVLEPSEEMPAVDLPSIELDRVRSGSGRAAAVAWSLAISRFRRRYLDSVLGYAWAILRPLAFFGVLYVVFTQIGRFDQGVNDYGLYLLMSIVFWVMFAESTSTALGSMVRSGPLLRSVPLPAIVIPLSVVISSLLDLAMNLIAVAAFFALAGIEPRLSWLELPLIVALITGFAVGVSLLLSSLYLRLRDVDQVWTILRQALFYGSPIFYVAAIYPESVRTALTALPLASAFTQARHALLDPTAPSLSESLGGDALVLIPIGITLITLALGIAAALHAGRTAAEHA